MGGFGLDVLGWMAMSGTTGLDAGSSLLSWIRWFSNGNGGGAAAARGIPL